MTQEGYRKMILRATDLAAQGQSGMLDKLALYLEQVDRAKSILQSKGYGVIGQPFIDMAQEAPELSMSR
jgi:hypothetical protein